MSSHGACATVNVASSSPLASKAALRDRWTMVWCYEGSHKQASMEHRSALHAIAVRSGGCFHCFRKAKQFHQWYLKQTKPFILCTDWREAKPCVQAMTKEGWQTRALFTIVVCASEKQKARAQAWHSKLTERRDIVHVVVNFSSIEWMVPSLLPLALRVLKNSADTQCSHDGGVQTQELQATPKTSLMQPTVACGKASSVLRQIKLEEAIQMESTQTSLATGESQPQDAMRTCNAFEQTHFRQHEVQVPQAPSPMVMGPWQSAPPTFLAPVWMMDNCPVKTEKILLEAQPDRYED